MTAFLRNLAATLCLAALGGYLLRVVPGLLGSVGGAVLILLALCIAFPTQMHDGGARLKDVLVLILPTVFDAVKGGDRKSDPPKDGAP